MDSLTHIAFGAAVVATVTPARQRRTALLAGAVIATLPDLDVLPLALPSIDVVTRVTWHRGPAHSLLVLPVLGLLLWLLLRHRWTPVREAPTRWLWAIELALLTHPLLDAFTVYGTQLLWPWPSPPVMWSSLFIIDPGFTLPLLITCPVAWYLRERMAARLWLLTAIGLSGAYLGWSLIAKLAVENAAEQALAQIGLQDAPRFSVPMPFNTLLWRVVVMQPDGYLEGERSLVADRSPMQFHHYPSDHAALAALSTVPAVRRLEWFTRGFLKAERRDGRILLSDLRMGSEPDYNFVYAVVGAESPDGRRGNIVEKAEMSIDVSRHLADTWQRIWHEPASQRAGE